MGSKGQGRYKIGAKSRVMAASISKKIAKAQATAPTPLKPWNRRDGDRNEVVIAIVKLEGGSAGQSEHRRCAQLEPRLRRRKRVTQWQPDFEVRP